MTAVSQAGEGFQHATEALKGNRELVMQAVSKDGFALRYASEKLRGDREIVMIAVSNRGEALQGATEELNQERKRHINLRKILGTPAGGSWDKQGSTDRCSRAFLLSIEYRK